MTLMENYLMKDVLKNWYWYFIINYTFVHQD